MFKDDDSFNSGEPQGQYTIFLCEGISPPQTIQDTKAQWLGSAVWDREGFDVVVDIKKTGIATWVVLYDGISITSRPMTFPGILVAGSQSTVHLKKRG